MTVLPYYGESLTGTSTYPEYDTKVQYKLARDYLATKEAMTAYKGVYEKIIVAKMQKMADIAFVMRANSLIARKEWYANDCTCSTTFTNYDTIGNYGLARTECDRIRYEYAEERREREQKTPMERLRVILQTRIAPAIVLPDKRRAVKPPEDIRETRARETLRRVLGDDLYRGFLKNGFVSAKGKSGRVYQIFPGHDFTRVFENGKPVEELCVVLSGAYTPCDSLLMRYVLLLNDESHFASLANRHRAIERKQMTIKALDVRPLTEILGSIRNPQPAAVGVMMRAVA